jgi:phosphoserine aminotransferase
MVKSQKSRAIMAEVVSKAIQDAAFRKKLIANPKKVLADAGATLDPKLTIKVVESTPSVCYVVLPAKEYMAALKDQIKRAKDRLDNLPDGLEVRICQNSAKRLFIALPASMAAKDGKLSDEALEMVAGGKGHSDTVQTAKVATTAYEAAEVSTSAVQVAEAAADAAVAGEAVAVGVVVFI